MSAELVALSWPEERLGEALEALARHAGLPAREATEAPPPPRDRGDRELLDRWLDGTASALGLELEPTTAMVKKGQRIRVDIQPVDYSNNESKKKNHLMRSLKLILYLSHQ
jgi:hypothetical protein